MLGIGILALITGGIAMSAGGGGGDDDEVAFDTTEDIVDPDEGEIVPIDAFVDPDETLGDDFFYFPAANTDQEIVNEVNQLILELRDVPGLQPEDAVAQIEALIDQLEAEAAAETPIVEEEPQEVIRPPVGDGFFDPTLNPPQIIVAADPEEDEEIETPQEPSATPEELVTVKTNTGSEFADSAVLDEGPSSGENADRDYIVTTSSVANDIDVGYDSQTTFLINYSNQTATVTASLNSNIQGPAGVIDTFTSTQADEDGTDYNLVSSELVFRDSADITMEISEEQIGVHVSQIDLTNPDDSLTFNFDSDVTGNLHLVYNDVEDETGDDTSTTRTLYVIETASSVSSLTAAEIAQILNEDGSAAQDTRLVAEVYLGEDSLTIDGDPASRTEYTLTMANFINDSPNIDSNVAWASIGENDGTVATGNGTSDPDTDDDFDTLDLPFNFPFI